MLEKSVTVSPASNQNWFIVERIARLVTPDRPALSDELKLTYPQKGICPYNTLPN